MPVDGMCCSRFRFYGNLLGYSINNIRSEKTLVISLIHDIYLSPFYIYIFQNFPLRSSRSLQFFHPRLFGEKNRNGILYVVLSRRRFFKILYDFVKDA